ncbi:hypothetical protein RLIN73S_04843 [Rhodanobacter lindaniclasticus]
MDRANRRLQPLSRFRSRQRWCWFAGGFATARRRCPRCNSGGGPPPDSLHRATQLHYSGRTSGHLLLALRRAPRFAPRYGAAVRDPFRSVLLYDRTQAPRQATDGDRVSTSPVNVWCAVALGSARASMSWLLPSTPGVNCMEIPRRRLNFFHGEHPHKRLDGSTCVPYGAGDRGRAPCGQGSTPTPACIEQGELSSADFLFHLLVVSNVMRQYVLSDATALGAASGRDQPLLPDAPPRPFAGKVANFAQPPKNVKSAKDLLHLPQRLAE